MVIQLKQQSCDLKWYGTVVAWLTQPEAAGGQGFRQSPHDPCLISKLKKTHPELFVGKQKKEKKKGKPTLISKSIDGEEIWVALYVDNLLITGHDELIEPFVAAISKQYVIRDMGVPEVFLDVRSSEPQTRSQSLSTAQNTLRGWLRDLAC